MNAFLNATYQVARKEVLQHIRTKRLLIIGGIMMLLLVMVTLVFGPNFAKEFTRGGSGDFPNALENSVLAIYFGIGLIGGLQFTQLLAIVLTGDAVCSEWANRTIFLLLSKPVSRVAFVTGKFLGNLFTVFAAISILFTLDYLVMQPFYAGSPDAAEVAGFFGMLGFILLGCAAFASISLFFSTLTKSTLMSFLLTLALWLIVFPLIGSIGLFTSLNSAESVDSQEEFFEQDRIQNWLYLNPAADMQAGLKALLPNDSGEFSDTLQFLNVFSIAPKNGGMAAFALIAYTVVFFAASVFVVKRRNFE
ncbi:MAG: ABC transporter permease [Candidatus Thermoplasmatota archaeon]